MLNLPEAGNGSTTLPDETKLVTDLAKDAPAVASAQGVVDAAPAIYTTLSADVGPAIKEAKAGYKTTEFWLTVAGLVLTQLGALHLPGHYGATITTVALAASYALSRGIAKAGVPTT